MKTSVVCGFCISDENARKTRIVKHSPYFLAPPPELCLWSEQVIVARVDFFLGGSGILTIYDRDLRESHTVSPT